MSELGQSAVRRSKRVSALHDISNRASAGAAADAGKVKATKRLVRLFQPFVVISRHLC